MEKTEVYRILNEAYFSPNAHEKLVLDTLAPLLQGVRFFVDVGASLGQYTLFANRYLKDADIWAIEADPIRFEELQRNCAKWSAVGNNRIRPIHCALADHSGNLVFHTSESNVSGMLSAPPATSGQTQDNATWREVTVTATTLEKLCGGQAPDFIKMDIEGAEHLALEGARAILNLRKTVLLIELHPFGGPDGRGTHTHVTTYMRELGYRRIWVYDHWLFVPSMAGYRSLAIRMALLRVLSVIRRRLKVKG